MGCRWNPIGFQFYCFLIVIFGLLIQGALSLNSEGLALLEFRSRIYSDPNGAIANWNPHDGNPCLWFGVHCTDGKVQMLDLSELSLEGNLVPELGKLHDLRSLVLYKNRFSGTIPKEFGGLTELQLLDLRENNLDGRIPGEIGSLLSLKHLLLCHNKFEGSIPLDLGRLKMLSEVQFDINLAYSADSGIGCMNRKVGHCIWHSSLNQLNKAESFNSVHNKAESSLILIKGAILHYLSVLPLRLFKLQKDTLAEPQDYPDVTAGSYEQQMVENVKNIVHIVRRRLLEQTQNLPAAPAEGESPADQIVALPITRSSGSFPAVPSATNKQSPPAPHDPPVQGTTSGQSSQTSNGASQKPSTPQTPTEASQQASSPVNLWKYLIIIPCGAVLLIALLMIILCRKRAVKVIGPWKTGLSGQLQKAFVTGVPKLNRAELETACEDFSNIIDTFEDCTVYKGTLSSGVEIAVASTSITSYKDWSKNSELTYRKKINILSRVNHKNFVNLIGYCEENEPFNRMMVFEYAPNGTLYEHLHVKETEHLDWNARMRIVMGIAYCLQYMHHDLNPPVAHSHLTSSVIFLTDDYAGKLAERAFGRLVTAKAKTSHHDESELPPNADQETNVYGFGILLLEVISGRLPYSEEQGPLEKWASQYLNDKKSISYMIDPTLKSVKNNELDVICEVIQECIQHDPGQRPTMKDVNSKLRREITITPDQATPKLSPLWWAELEILSVEAT
ncbi:hypothetical protein SLA2020_405760 [Shorea laevis]